MEAIPRRAPGSGQGRGWEQELQGPVIHRDLELARQIQKNLLPRSFPELPGFQVAAFCQSARQVGGDFYDVIPLQSGAALFLIADAMGKGVPAAMLAATLRALVRTLVQYTENPGDLLARVNRLMFQELSSVDMFITAQLAVIDAVQRQVTVASAGHCPLLLRTRDADTDPISPEGVPIGIMPEALYVETVVPLKPGAALLFYTDGLTEARNRQGEFFSQDALEKWFDKACSANLPAAELREKLQLELVSFESGSPPVDDQSFIVVTSCTPPATAAAANASVSAELPSILQLAPARVGSPALGIQAFAEPEIPETAVMPFEKPLSPDLAAPTPPNPGPQAG